MNGGGGAYKEFPDLTEATRRSGAALIAATQIGDELAKAIAAIHMLGGIDKITAHVNVSPELDQAIAVLLTDLFRHFGALLRNTTRVWPSDTSRLLRWSAARSKSEFRSSADPEFFETVASATELGAIIFEQLHMMQCNFRETDLVGSNFDGAILESNEFARANLARTSWHGVRAAHCNFSGTVMVDAILDDATFIDCDFRGADLAATNFSDQITARNTLFVGCDLRGSGWDARLIDHARFEDCRFYGVHGMPRITEIDIERADLSAAGNRSQLGHASDVLGAWNGARFQSS